MTPHRRAGANRDTRPRRLAAFTYVEYAGNWNAIDDLLNIQYVQYTSQMKVVDGIIDHGTNVNIPEKPNDFKEKDQGRHSFQAVAGAEVIGYETDREAFLGPYRTYANPLAVERGACCNSLGYGDNPSGSLQVERGICDATSEEVGHPAGINSQKLAKNAELTVIG